MRPRLGSLLASAALVASSLALMPSAATAADADRLDEARAELAELPNAPLISSDNVRHLSENPSQVGISGCFMKTAPTFVMSGLDSVRVYDATDAARPQLTGVLPSVQFENEAMNCAERRTRGDIRRFALVGVDTHQVSPDDIQHANVGGGELVLVEVTDPSDPHVVSRTPSTTSTHTVACVQQWDCTFAYSAGESESKGVFSIFDLRDPDNPHEVDSDPSVAGIQPFRSPTAAHKWNFDEAGFGTHTGWNGSSIFDVSDPTSPRLVTTTNEVASGEYDSDPEADPELKGYNNFIHHNSFRPNASAFRPDVAPSLANGNILLVTEEDYEQTDCSRAGSFQTWWIKRLDGTPDAIVPLDKVELADLGSYPLPIGAFCSAHWFEYHESGIVAIGYYGGGTQFVDVRSPADLRPYGHAYWGASEVWDAMWVPVYNKNDKVTDRLTNVVYSIDLARGLDVYAVDLPGDGRGATPPQGTGTSEASGLAAAAVPMGLTGGSLAIALALRRRARRRT